MKTIYQQAKDTMNDEIARYLALIQASNSFSELKAEHLFEPHTALLFAAGIDAPDNCINNPNLLIAEFQRKIAIPFDVERAVSSGVYNNCRLLFEEIVAFALREQGVNFLRETEYSSLSGVIYNFRSDFIIPDSEHPIAFIEVRKSSSRHASLYAKDKMFSAINWKGKHKNLIGVMVVEGDWTKATLETMSYVFDYVVPLNRVTELAKTLRKAQDGDESILKWLVNFSISQSPKFAQNSLS